MPARNRFRHQSYISADLTSRAEQARIEVREASPPAPVGSAEFREQLSDAGVAFRDAGVRYLYLLHGTFAGNDAFGLFGEIARYFPEVGESLRSLGKSTFDRVIGEAGNYTAEFAAQMQDGLNAGRAESDSLQVRRFHWSSENNHIARADAAVALLDELAALDLTDGDRILLWCHSHAGNVLALLTNLIACDASDRRRFFQACRSFYRWPKLRRIDLSRWPRVRELLSRGEHLILHCPLDVATFGTPVRYGWDTGGCSRLMHVVHHQRNSSEQPWQAAFPPTREDLLNGHGDFIQQVGIAGTDFPPGPLTWRSWLANSRLSTLLAPNLPRRGLLSRLKFGQRVHADGRQLLIDYGPQEGNIAQHMLGHAVYTRQSWMAFHAREVARAYYE